jgi:hypothetical protein
MARAQFSPTPLSSTAIYLTWNRIYTKRVYILEEDTIRNYKQFKRQTRKEMVILS